MGAIIPATTSGLANFNQYASQGGWQPVAYRFCNQFNAAPFQITSIKGTANRALGVRLQYIACYDSNKLKLQFANFGGDQALFELNGRNSFEVRGFFQKMGANTADYNTTPRIPITFDNGKPYMTVMPGALATSDAMFFQIYQNERFYVWYTMSVLSSQYALPNALINIDSNAFSASVHQRGEAIMDDDNIAGNTAPTFGGTNYPAPVAILGVPPTPKPSVGWIGDSITGGTADCGMYIQGGGYATRVALGFTTKTVAMNGASVHANLTPNFPMLLVSRASQTSNTYAMSLNSNKSSRYLEQCSTIVYELGVNDLSFALAILQANLLQVARWYMSRGKKFVVLTVLPQTSTTDNWLTTGNQTFFSQYATRDSYNSWLVDTSSTGFLACASGTGGLAWAQSTAYARLGYICNPSGTQAYQLITTGTSSATGTGPTGLGQIVDGTCVWQSISVINGLCDYIDISSGSGYEVNSSNVATFNGNYIVTTPAPIFTGAVTTSINSSAFNDTSLGGVVDQYRGYNLRFTSGNCQNPTGNFGILYNYANNLINLVTAPTANTPQVGDTYAIYAPAITDGTHPTSYGHALIANCVANSVNMAKLLYVPQ